jgi:predicted DNA-binding WGR domain protein
VPRYFEFHDGRSDKFWEIALDGRSFTVRFGKVGAAGQTQTKEFASEAKALAEHDKLVAEKVKKGYVEHGGGGPAPSAPAAAAVPAAVAAPPSPKPAAADVSTPVAPAPAAVPEMVRCQSRPRHRGLGSVGL